MRAGFHWQANLVVLLFCCTFPRVMSADVLELVNGDIVSGQVHSMNEQNISLKSSVLGTLTISRAKVKAIHLGVDQLQPKLPQPTIAPKPATPAKPPTNPAPLPGKPAGKIVSKEIPRNGNPVVQKPRVARLQEQGLPAAELRLPDQFDLAEHRAVVEPPANRVAEEPAVPQRRGGRFVDPTDRLIDQLVLRQKLAAEGGLAERLLRQARGGGVIPHAKHASQQLFPPVEIPDPTTYFNGTISNLLSARRNGQDVRAEAVRARKMLIELKGELGQPGEALDGYLRILNGFLGETAPQRTVERDGGLDSRNMPAERAKNFTQDRPAENRQPFVREPKSSPRSPVTPRQQPARFP